MKSEQIAYVEMWEKLSLSILSPLTPERTVSLSPLWKLLHLPNVSHSPYSSPSRCYQRTSPCMFTWERKRGLDISTGRNSHTLPTRLGGAVPKLHKIVPLSWRRAFRLQISFARRMSEFIPMRNVTDYFFTHSIATALLVPSCSLVHTFHSGSTADGATRRRYPEY